MTCYSGRTEKEPPRVLDLLAPTAINVTNIEETKIKIDLDVSNFRDDYGKISYYAIWVRLAEDLDEELSDYPSKPGKVPIRWTKVSGVEIIQFTVKYREVNAPIVIARTDSYSNFISQRAVQSVPYRLCRVELVKMFGHRVYLLFYY